MLKPRLKSISLCFALAASKKKNPIWEGGKAKDVKGAFSEKIKDK